VVLSAVQDNFFRANMFENFGDLGMNVKRMVDDFQHLSKSSQNFQSIGKQYGFFLLSLLSMKKLYLCSLFLLL
jgi:vacuolar protein sorting-associated protein 45